MKQRKLTPVQAQALMRRITGITNVVYKSTEALAYATVNDKQYQLVFDNSLQFTGLAYRIA